MYIVNSLAFIDFRVLVDHPMRVLRNGGLDRWEGRPFRIR